MMGNKKKDIPAYVVKRSNRKSLGLTIERDGAIVVRAPLKLGFDEIERFVSEKRIWIQQKLAQKAAVNREKPKREFVNGQGFLYLGRSYRLRYLHGGNGTNLRSQENGFDLKLKQGYFELGERQKTNARRHFVSWYRRKTEEKLRERLPRYDKRLGVQVEGYRVSDLGHRWASHSRKGVINMNWRTIMAPIWVFDYVLVHELAHIIVSRHSKEFRRLVSRVIPEYEEYDRWLSENGADLDL